VNKIKNFRCLLRKSNQILNINFIDLLLKSKESIFLILIFFITVFRNGLGIHGASKNLFYEETGRRYDLTEYSSSPIFLLLKILVHGNYIYWLAIHIFCMFAVLISFIYLARKLLNPISFRISLFLFSLSPLISVMLKTIGYYDPFVYLAIIIGTLARRKSSAYFAGFLFATSHSQAAVVSSIGLYFMLKTGPFKKFQLKLNTLLFVKVSFFSGLFVSILSYFFWRSERYTLIKGGLSDAIYSFFYSLPQHIYCTFGSLWIFIFIATSVYIKRGNSLVEPIFLIFLAYSVQFITNDGTRISLLITGSSLIIFIIMFSEIFYKNLLSNQYLVLSSIVTPAIIVQNIYINPSYRQFMMLIKKLIG